SAMITAAIANDGVMMQPYILECVTAGDKVIEQYEAVALGNVMTEEESAIIKRMMRSVVTDGTTVSLQTDLYEAYGKTGTAEYITGSDAAHAWFTGFAGEGDDRIAISVVLEGAGTGSQQAAPVAAAVFEKYFLR
ncbi:MAG: penicillin-binding protein 2, partial [Lachnospiraceae bacterium]|nr:penicillin-binding protein 2 [Lachnospiraceae bacterium]